MMPSLHQTNRIRYYCIYLILAPLLVNTVDAGSNDYYKNTNNNYPRTGSNRGGSATTGLLFQNDGNDAIANTIMKTDTTIRSTVLQRLDDATDILSSSGGSDHKSNILIHDNIDDDDDLILLRNRGRNQRVEMSSRHRKQLNLAWRSEPNPVIVQDDYDNFDTDTMIPSHLNHNKKQYTKTGTTIVGVCGTNYCILGADSRATSQTIIADKYCSKLHPLSQNCAAAGAGTSADLDHITRECYYQIQLWLATSISSTALSSIGNHPIIINTTSSINVVPQISVQQICRYIQHRLYEQRGTCQANLIVGGVEMSSDGSTGRGILRAIHPQGSIDIVSFTALGSGSYAAMGVLESAIIQNNKNNHTTTTTTTTFSNDGNAQHNLTIDEAIALVVKAVKAGIDHDLGSGSQVDLCIITSNGIANYTRCYLPEEKYSSHDKEQSANSSVDVTNVATSSTNDDDEDANISRHGTAFQKVGINGFGNVPYIIRSSKRVQQHSNLNNKGDDKAIVDRWEGILPSR